MNPEVESDPRLPKIPASFKALDEDFEESSEELPTLSDVGKVLPIGYVDSKNVTHKTFELIHWDFEVEEALGEIIEKEPEMPIGQYLSEVIGHGLSKLGTIDVTKLKRSERRLLVHNMFYSDALYIYIWIRIGALGKSLKLDPFPCGKCKTKIDYVGDLTTLEVKSLDKPPKLEVELEHGLEYGGQRRKKVVLGGLKWSFMETEDSGILINPAKMKLHTIKSGIISVEGMPEGVPVVITREVLKSMTMNEINKLVHEIDSANGGAVMEIAGSCPKCKSKFSSAVDWSYESFFGRSSQ